MRLSPSHSASQLGQSTTVFQQAVGRLFVRMEAPLSRSVGELLSADMLNSSSMLSTHEASTPKLYPPSFFYQGSSQVACWFCRHFAALELEVSDQFSEEFLDDLVRSSQQQVVHVDFVVCVHRQVSSMFGTKPHFVRICSRWFCQRFSARLRP